MIVSRDFIIKAFGAVLLIVLTAPVALLLLALQRNAEVPAAPPLSHAEISRIEQLLLDSAPGDVRNSELRSLSLSNQELNLLLRYATELIGTDSGINGRIMLPGQALHTEVSVQIANTFRPVWLNLEAEFSSTGEQLQLESLNLGHLEIPGNLVQALAAHVEARFLENVPTYLQIVALLESVQRINIAEDQLQLDFMWEPELIAQVRTEAQQLLISGPDQHRIVKHYENLAAIIDSVPVTTRAIPLSSLLSPLFASARNQSNLGADPVAENRTLLLAIAAYVNTQDMASWLEPQLAEQLPRPRYIEVRIQRRQDLAHHLVLSAAIAASAGAGVAQVISKVKESYDARYRSGFSFSDLAANTAGMAIGSLATENRESALEMQVRMSGITGDVDYLPALGSNRDGLSETDFNELYGAPNSPEYQRRVREMESLIFQLPLFDGLAKH